VLISYNPIRIYLKLLLCFCMVFTISCVSSQEQTLKKPQGHRSLNSPGHSPQRIILNLTEDPCASQAVTWRTLQKTRSPLAQFTAHTGSLSLIENSITTNAISDIVKIGNKKFVYHYSTVFKNLRPDTIYSYRVGSEGNFSEWSLFKTAKKGTKPLQFVYLGDPQNQIKSMCSQIFRAAYKKAPDADFWLFIGDLVNDGENDEEWDEFFYGLGFIPRTTPMILLPGNHEYPDKRVVKGKNFKLTPLWRPHFTLPENGPQGLKESVYFIDYQGVRFVMLNGNEKLEEQAIWLDKILAENPQEWTIAAIHQPIFSTAKFRKKYKKKKKDLFSPVFDKYAVDLVLQGHDHTYSRTYKIKNRQRVKENEKGTVYIISVCGPKVYSATPNFRDLMAKSESGRQLFQVIDIDQNKLSYKAFNVKGELYDSFELKK